MSGLTPEQDIEGHAFNALTASLGSDPWLPLSQRLRHARPVTAAVEPVIREYEQQRIVSAIQAQFRPCREHPGPLPSPSCPRCARNSALRLAAMIAAGCVRPAQPAGLPR